MAIGAEQLLVGLANAWQGSVILKKLVPGGLWSGEVPQTALEPYAGITIKEESVIMLATKDWIKTDLVEVRVYSSKPSDDTSRLEIANEIATSWCSVPSSVTMASGSVMSIIPSSATAELVAERRDGEDMLLVTLGYTAMTQGTY